MISSNMQVKDGFRLSGLHFSAVRSCASAHGGVPGASWPASAYPDCWTSRAWAWTRLQSCTTSLNRRASWLIPDQPYSLCVDHMDDGMASTALLSPALSLQEHRPREDILPESNQASRPPNPQLLDLFTKEPLVPDTQQRISG